MKILFVSTEFEEQARGITSIIKTMVSAAKANGHEVGVLVGYPKSDQGHSEKLDSKVEHLFLQHYLNTGKQNLYPSLRTRKNQIKILANQEYTKIKEMRVQHELITDKSSMANSLDFIIKIPYIYRFMNNGLGRLVKPSLKKAVKKYAIDLVITGAPMDLTKRNVTPAKLVQFVHDTMPIDLLEVPADNSAPQKFARSLYVAVTKSDLVLSNSVDTASKVEEVNPDAKIKVLYSAAPSKPEKYTDTAYLTRKSLEKDRYLLFVSVIERRKNLSTLFDAYAKAYPKIKLPLVVVGGKGFGYKQIMAHHKDLPDEIRNNIIFTGFISHADKHALMNNARAFVFPSIYEGLGLPVLEAFASNLPVLTSNRGALPEAGGDAALYIEDPLNTDELADGIVRIVEDEKLRQKLRDNIPKQLDMFAKDKYLDRFKEALDSLGIG